MKKFKTILSFKIVLAIVILGFISCSKDSEEPTMQETTVTVSATDFSKTLDENPSNGQVIGTVQGSTNQGSVNFSITEQSPAGAFSIDAASGELKVVDASLFEFETNPTITGTVKVANGSVFKNALITINLNDLGNTYDGDLILKTQQEVNDFGTNHYTKINGSLTVGDPEESATTDIFDLSPLQSLKTISGNFWIINNPNLISTVGLSLNNVGGDLAITINSSLKKVEGLNNITSVLTLAVTLNDVLYDLSGVSQISTIGDELVLANCPQILNLDWLSNLTTIGERIFIRSCYAITNIDGLSNLRNLTGQYPSILLSYNRSLTNLNGLSNLNTDLINLELDNNSSLKNIEGLGNLRVTSALNIHGNQELENLNGLESITNLAYALYINDNNALNDLQGLRNVTFAHEIHFYRNESLLSLEGLNSLFENWKTDIQGNQKLTDFCALQNLFAVDPSAVFTAAYNAYNPTKQDIIDGNCSL